MASFCKQFVIFVASMLLFVDSAFSSPIRRSVSSMPQIVSLLIEEQRLQANQMQLIENATTAYATALPEIMSLLTAGQYLQAKQVELLETATTTSTAALPEIISLLETHSQQLGNISASLERLEQKFDETPSLLTSYLKQQGNVSEMLVTSFETITRGIPLTARDCSDIADQGPYASGPYTITPWDELGPVKVWCDMDTQGSGWTVFQKRFDGSVNFYRDWADYVKGFGDVDGDGEYWLGLANLNRLTSTGQSWELRVDLEDFDGNTSYAHYNRFAVQDESNQFRLTLGTYDGTARDAMMENKKALFSTKDRDHDSSDLYHCAEDRQGAWWYASCTYSNLNGLYLGRGKNSPRSMYWHKWKETPEALKKSEMKIRPVG